MRCLSVSTVQSVGRNDSRQPKAVPLHPTDSDAAHDVSEEEHDRRYTTMCVLIGVASYVIVHIGSWIILVCGSVVFPEWIMGNGVCVCVYRMRYSGAVRLPMYLSACTYVITHVCASSC